MNKPFVDWTPHYKYSKSTITCECGAVYRSYSKHVLTTDKRFVGVTETPCPNCGKEFDHIRKAENDPEVWTI
jgi:hypothetical protein